LDSSNTDEEKERPSKQMGQKSVKNRYKSKLSKKERTYITFCNIIMGMMILLDLYYLIGFIRIQNYMLFTLANLVSFSLGYISYRIKRRARTKTIKLK